MAARPDFATDLRAMCKRHYLGTNLAQQAATLNDLHLVAGLVPATLYRRRGLPIFFAAREAGFGPFRKSGGLSDRSSGRAGTRHTAGQRVSLNDGEGLLPSLCSDEPRAERTDQRVRQRSTHRVRDFVFARFAERPVFARPTFLVNDLN